MILNDKNKRINIIEINANLYKFKDKSKFKKEFN